MTKPLNMTSDISFADTSIAFSYKSDRSLKRSYFLFFSINSPLLTKLGTNIVKIAFKVKAPVKGIIKRTLFSQFCGGESIETCEQTIQMLGSYGVKSILDFAVEGNSVGHDRDKTTEEILRTIDRASGNPNTPFSVFKPSGIAPGSILEKIQLRQKLSQDENLEFERVRDRFHKIAARAHEKGVAIFVDSEDSWYQDPVDMLVNELMEKFNRDGVVVYNTYQMYRKGMLGNLMKIEKEGVGKGFFVGAKLVRGAYMEKERLRAEEKGYDDPILADKDATDRQYDEGQDFCLKNIDHMALASCTHNEESNRKLVAGMEKSGLKPNDTRVYFAQLFGMSDNITFNLANAGYNVAKYVPYGPVEVVMPYLIRRAEENTSIAGHSSRELQLIRQEIKRRRLA